MYKEFTTTKQEEKTKHNKYHGKKSIKTRIELNEIKPKKKLGDHNNKTKKS